ncbi:MAG: stage III sporulation protein AB [Flavonifractor sp.]|nr:stage III sporulation protein AB [Lawsonibacter sp.]MCI9424748.1 stage III sporulation protein AB [Flavonifractor sp.]MCI9472405.1 stage III sporulation protein AB [Flavonifractor sp.]
MLRLAGALMVAGGMSTLGFLAAGGLGRRVRTLRALAGALELMERELSFRLPPMPELLEGLAKRAPPPADRLFARCRAGLADLGERSLGELWREGLAEFPLKGDERLLLEGLGEVLGRYDGEGQRSALREARSALEGMLEEAQAERVRLGRVYQVTGTAAGAALAILLL